MIRCAGLLFISSLLALNLTAAEPPASGPATGKALAKSAANAAPVALPKTLMTKPGEVLFEQALNAVPAKNIARSNVGDWTAVDGVLRGAERVADMHGAVMRFPLKFQDAVIRYDFQLDGCKTHTLSLNDEKEHVARVLFTSKSMTTQKDDHDHMGPDKAVKLQVTPVELTAGTWHTVVIELLGTEIVATLDGEKVSFGGHEMLAVEKANFGFTIAGQSAKFRNLTVWSATANPDWNATKTKLGK